MIEQTVAGPQPAWLVRPTWFAPTLFRWTGTLRNNCRASSIPLKLKSCQVLRLDMGSAAESLVGLWGRAENSPYVPRVSAEA